MKEKISNFSKKQIGYGHAILTYQSAKTGKVWSKTIETNSNLFHNVFEVENPTQKSMNDLKKYIKL